MMNQELDAGTGTVTKWSVPWFFNLYLDPKEEHALSYEYQYFWVRYPAARVLADHLASFQKYPPIKPGAPEPYMPPS